MIYQQTATIKIDATALTKRFFAFWRDCSSFADPNATANQIAQITATTIKNGKIYFANCSAKLCPKLSIPPFYQIFFVLTNVLKYVNIIIYEKEIFKERNFCNIVGGVCRKSDITKLRRTKFPIAKPSVKFKFMDGIIIKFRKTLAVVKFIRANFAVVIVTKIKFKRNPIRRQARGDSR